MFANIDSMMFRIVWWNILNCVDVYDGFLNRKEDKPWKGPKEKITNYGKDQMKRGQTIKKVKKKEDNLSSFHLILSIVCRLFF
jgi:hypothetical protein